MIRRRSSYFKNLVSPWGDIILDGLIFDINAANPSSYPGYGSVWLDVSANHLSTYLTNNPVFNSFYIDFGNDNIKRGFRISSTIGLTADSPQSLSMWVKINTQITGDDPYHTFYLLSKTYYLGSTSFQIYYDGTLHISKYSEGNQTENGVSAYGIMTPGTWYNIVLTYDGNYLKGFVNGVLCGIVSVPGKSGTFTQSYTDQFGSGEASSSLARSTKYAISRVNVYNRALTDIEVLNNFNSTRSLFLV